MTETIEVNDEAQHDGHNVVDEVNLAEWVVYDTEAHSEYVHVVTDPANAELRCYRTTNDDFPNERVKTTIENVKIRFIYDDDLNRHRSSEAKQVSHFFLSWRRADTFIAAVDMIAHNREPGSLVRLLWYENNASPALKKTDVGFETIDVDFTNLDGDKRQVQIADTWIAPSNQMARYEEDK